MFANVLYEPSAGSVHFVPLNTAVMFGKASDEWETPQDFFDALDAEFGFALDVAATRANTKCAGYLGFHGLEPDALAADWRHAVHRVEDGTRRHACWMNCPYSHCRAFIAKAAQEARKGCTVVCLVPSRTDTRWWHSDVWDASTHACRPGVEVRFIKGRLKFGNSENSAPFPSVVIVFRPVPA